jgi:hypothetical protein
MAESEEIIRKAPSSNVVEAPSTNIQAPEKLQILSSAPLLELGVGCFSGGWSLGLGASLLESSPQAALFQEAIIMAHQEMGFHLAHGIEQNADHD